jgi:DNA-binding GntR family transcriptional regulator
VSIQNIRELRRNNLASDVADILRDTITNGELPPGTRLVEQDVSQQLGISRGPLREALRLLETEGLVNSYPGRGSFVAELSEKDIVEIYSLRTILEEMAIRLASRKSSSEDLMELEKILEDMFRAANEDNHVQVLNLDLHFHHKIWEMADHARLEEFLREIAVQAKMYIAVQTSMYDDLPTGISDHKTILTHLKAGNEDAAVETIRLHLREAEASLRTLFEE